MADIAEELATLEARWHHDARARLVVAVLAGVVVAALVPLWNGTFAPILAWAAAAGTYCLITWLALGRLDPAQTAVHAAREIPGALGIHLLLIGASLASLGGIGVLLAQSSESRVIAAAVALVCIVASWVTVQTVHALRYARQYYRDGYGFDFHARPDYEGPQYSDFAYIAFTVGMSFAISDTDVQSPQMRKIALFHALLAYLFGTVFLAALVNILASLGG
ncbi:MAG: DUF1345 domain-containing protein [Promicromonosporaceae bacterium]|nr:DUF1345 domain-containing protein [Promicromonosporaceae bacterium]